MSAAFKKIRREAAKRAKGLCEAGCGAWIGLEGEDGHADHFFGRAKVPESISNVWLLCVACDSSRTNNQPTAVYWLVAFISHATKYGFVAEAQLADTKLETLRAKGLAEVPR